MHGGDPLARLVGHAADEAHGREAVAEVGADPGEVPRDPGGLDPVLLREQRGLRRRGFQIPVAAIGEIEDAVVVADPDHGQVAAAQPQGDVDRHPGGDRGEMEGAARQLHPGTGTIASSEAPGKRARTRESHQVDSSPYSLAMAEPRGVGHAAGAVRGPRWGSPSRG